jgi:glycosyltransferase involved in cell wall biosynthesis
MKQTLTVIVPVYNSENYLEEAIESIQKQEQTIFSIDIVAVDDASTDGSLEKLKALSVKYNNIKIIALPENRGPADARNEGIKAAKGDWLSFVDHDDCWTEDKLTVQYHYMQDHPDMDFVLAHQIFNLVRGKEKPSWAKPEWFEGPLAGHVFGAILIKRSDFLRVGLLNPDLKWGGDDVDWFIRAKQMGLVRHIVKPVLLHRKIHDTNLSRETKGG